jgi:hypothetical protein
MTDDLELLHVPPADSKIRCATQTREYPTTRHAAGASGGWLDAAGRSFD